MSLIILKTAKFCQKSTIFLGIELFFKNCMSLVDSNDKTYMNFGILLNKILLIEISFPIFTFKYIFGFLIEI
jgi:hypothetical protein